MEDDVVNGFALAKNPNGWQWRTVQSDWVLNDGETFYVSVDDFPQEAKDWFAEHVVY